MSNITPPRWAETIFRFLLAPHDRETVSGDLLEEYRESVYPARGRRRADAWYVRQVAGFAWRENRSWAGLFSAAFIARTSLDWFMPTADFHNRATTSTLVGACIIVGAGFLAAWRSNSVRAGTVAGIATTLLAAIVSTIGVAALFAIWHDPQTRAAIQGSGGLEEALVLPFMMVVPGVCLGTLGGLLGGGARKVV
jgi:hypothetical protein